MKTLSCLLVLYLTVPAHTSPKILNTPNGSTGSSSCSLTCSGVSRYDGSDSTSSTKWRYHDDSAQSTKHVDMSGCGFSSPPVVTATIKSKGVGKYYCPPVYLLAPSATSVEVITVPKLAPDWLRRSQCNVYWVAVGYRC